MSVFVTDGDQRSTLAVTRALGRAGMSVTVGGTSPVTLAGSSRYCRNATTYPSPISDTATFADFLVHETHRAGFRVLIPMTDITTQIAAGLMDDLRPAVVPVPGLAEVRRVQDKGQVLCMAQRLGIGCPTTYMTKDGDKILDVAQHLEYPVVIKPRWSHYPHAGSWVHGSVQYAYEADDLIVKYHAADLQMPRPLVQELIRGDGIGAFLLMWDGELKAALCHRRIREKPPSGGVSVLRETIPLDVEMIDQSLALLKEIGWRGVAMVEFKMDRRDRRPKLMEVNGRFWGSLQLAVDAGINFPLLLYRLATGERVDAVTHYRIGVKTRWLLGDLDQLLIRLRHPHNGIGTESESRLRACLEFLKFYEKDMHYEVFTRDDPRPGWLEAKQWLHEALGRGGA